MELFLLNMEENNLTACRDSLCMYFADCRFLLLCLLLHYHQIVIFAHCLEVT